MSWRFRQSFNLFPGVKINVSKSGLSATIGGGPLHLNLSQSGLLGTASLPGTGISFRQNLIKHGGSSPSAETVLPGVVPVEFANSHLVTGSEIKSADANEMTSDGMNEFLSLIIDAMRERRELDLLLNETRQIYAKSNTTFESWDQGFWRKTFAPRQYSKLKESVLLSRAKIDEYEEQRKQTVIPTEIEISAEEALKFEHLCEVFSKLVESEMIWDVVSEKAIDKEVDRTTASASIGRHRVFFSLNSFSVISSKWVVPHLGNYNGGDIFLYPGFILYHINDLNFTVIDYRDVKITFSEQAFIEESTVPKDSKTISFTWKKTNRDGSPDKRYKGNYQIPVCRYAQIKLTSLGGLMEEYMISDCDTAKDFVVAFSDVLRSGTRH